MKFRTTMVLSAVLWTGIAISRDNLAAAYASAGIHVAIWLLHALEVKINRLLDDRGIRVSEREIAE